MSRLNDATQRLQAALDRLERIADDRARPAAAGGDEAGELRSALQASRADNARLKRTADQASEQLDAAIARLCAMLEG